MASVSREMTTIGTRTMSGTADGAATTTDIYPIKRGYTFAGFEPTLQPIKQVEQMFFRAHTGVGEFGKDGTPRRPSLFPQVNSTQSLTQSNDGMSYDVRRMSISDDRRRMSVTDDARRMSLSNEQVGATRSVRPIRLSMQMDRKVVGHLRRKFNKRRYSQVLMMVEDEEDSDTEYNGETKPRAPSMIYEPSPDIFHKYTELGEKVPRQVRRPVLSSRGSAHGITQLGHTLTVIEQEDDTPHTDLATDNLPEDRQKSTQLEKLDVTIEVPQDSMNRKTPLPAITQTEDTQEDESAAKEEDTGDGQVRVEDDEDAADVPTLPEISQETRDTIVRELTKEITISPEHVPELHVSPVPTPYISRPSTRADSLKMAGDEELRIMKGNMHIKYAAPTNIIKVFVHSSFTDSVVERTVLMEKILPVLKASYIERGYEFDLIDPHWGVTDLVSENHSDQELCLSLVRSAAQNDETVNFMTFIGEKCGSAILPSEIDVKEFEKILSAAEQDHSLLVQRAAEVAAKAEAAAQAREREKRERAAQTGRLSSSGSTPPVSTRSTDGKSTVGVIEEDIEEETESMQAAREEEELLLKTREKTESLMSTLKKEVTRIGIGALMMKKMRDTSDPNESADPMLLKKWYQLDKNYRPHAYKLKKISTHIKDFYAKDSGKRAQAVQQWLAVKTRLSKMFISYSETLFTTEQGKKYKTTLLEKELKESCGRASSESRYWVQREFEDLYEHLSDPASRDYVDLITGENKLDVALQTEMNGLKKQYLHSMSMDRVWKYQIPWHYKGVAPSALRAHQVYLERMGKELLAFFGRCLDDLSEKSATKGSGDFTDEIAKEVLQHITFCQKSSRMFHGRRDLLQSIKDYIRSDFNSPLVVHGKSGVGKTLLMAKAAKEATTWLKECGSVLVRMIRVTSSSINIRLLLRSLCLQLCAIYNYDPEDIPKDYKGMLNDFAFRISLASEAHPVVIFIDSLHCLTDENDAHKLSWLPKTLPPYCKIIVSTLDEDGCECFKHLKKGLSANAERAFIKVPELPTEDALHILNYWLKSDARAVTQEQKRFIMSCFESCQLPLYLRVIYNEALLWQSTMTGDELKLPNGVKKVITVMFGRLERLHGEPLARRALGYLTAARNGIMESEMQDLLSLDESVMDDVLTYNPNLPLRRIPPLFWLRLRHDLSDYITCRLADNVTTITWSHMQFHSAADDRYLQQKDKAPSYHKAMAEYFLDMWNDTPKPYSGNEKGCLRYVCPQPLSRVNPYTLKTEYNLRRLNELPYHLLRSQQMDMLKSECLCNYECVHAKVMGTSLRSLFEDIALALSTEPTDKDINLLSDTMHLSIGALQNNPAQLGSQVVGRLHEIITRDVPVAPGDPVKYPAMKKFFAQASCSTTPMLLPSKCCLTSPGGILFDLLSGHTEPITAVCTSTDGQRAITTSMDNTMKQWELRTGRVMKTIVGVGVNVRSIRLGAANILAVTSELTCIRMWSLRSGDMLAKFEGFQDPAAITTAGDGSLLVAFFDGSCTMRVWELQDQLKMILEQDVTGESRGIHADNSIVVSPNSYGMMVLYAYRSSSIAYIRHAKKGEQIWSLNCNSGSINALAASREYFIVGVRLKYMKLHEIFQLDLFDVRDGKAVRSIRGCLADGSVTDLYVNMLGSHCLAICTSDANHTSDIAVWNIETEDHKHIAKHPKVSHIGACVDMRYCLTAGVKDNTLRIWNLSNKVNQNVPKEKAKEGIEQIVAMQDFPRYVVARSMNNGPLSVWNVLKDHGTGRAVRVDRGLVDSQDALVIHNHTAVILTDRGFVSIGDVEGRAMFQTVLVYNLKEKKFIHKMQGCYIVPSPQHEYAILNNDKHLLGLSENRTHFVVWSLETGHVDFRIKTSFKEEPRKNIYQMDDTSAIQRGSTAKMTAWDRRTETMTAKNKRRQVQLNQHKQHLESLHKEKDNAIEQYLVTYDRKRLVASYYAHHICIFDVQSRSHMQTLENNDSMLLLHVGALTPNGSHLVHANYDEVAKTSYVTLWDCNSGSVQRRVKNEKNVCAIAISAKGDRVVFGKESGELRIWQPGKKNMKKIKGYPGLNFGVGSQIHIVGSEGKQALVYAGDISMWDLDRAEVIAVFSPDTRIQCLTVCMNGQLCVFGLMDSTDVVTLRLQSRDSRVTFTPEQRGDKLFNESSDEEDDDDPEPGDEEDSQKDAE